MTPVRSSSHRIPGPVPRSRSFTADVRRRYRCHTLARSPTPAPVSRRVSIAHRRRYHAGPLSLIGTGTTVSFFYRRLHQCQSFHARSRSLIVTGTGVTPGLAGSPLPALVSHRGLRLLTVARTGASVRMVSLVHCLQHWCHAGLHSSIITPVSQLTVACSDLPEYLSMLYRFSLHPLL